MNEVFIVVILSLKATKQQTQEYLIKLQNFNALTCIKIKIKIKIDSHSWRSHCCEPTGFHPFHLQGHGPTCLGESDHHCSNHLIKNLDPPSTLLSLESFFNNPYVGLYLEALVFDIRLSVRPSTKEIRAIFNWNYTNSFSNLFYRHHHLHHHNHDNHNANLYLVPVLQFLVPLGSLGLETFSSDLDLQISFGFVLMGIFLFGSLYILRILWRHQERLLLTFYCCRQTSGLPESPADFCSKEGAPGTSGW